MKKFLLTLSTIALLATGANAETLTFEQQKELIFLREKVAEQEHQRALDRRKALLDTMKTLEKMSEDAKKMSENSAKMSQELLNTPLRGTK